MQLENQPSKMKYNKKARAKQRDEGNGAVNGKIEIVDGEKRKDGRRKSGEKYKLDQQGGEKKGKKELSQNNAILRSDSPGIDLSIFEPRGKRRCVIQNELKKQRDWWSDGEEEEEEEEEDDNIDADGEGERGGDEARGRRVAKSNEEIEEEILDEEEDEIEEEIIDDDDDDEIDDVISDDRLKIDVFKNEEKPSKPPKRKPATKASNGVNHTKKKEDCAPKNIYTNGVENACRYFVFSTAMANRAGHAVSKGLHDSISNYHASRKWETPYLNAEIHCRPFVAEFEDKLIADALKEKETKTETSRKVQNSSKLQKAASLDHQKPPTVKDEQAKFDKDRTLSVDSWQKEQVIQTAQRLNNKVADLKKESLQQHQQKTQQQPQQPIPQQKPAKTKVKVEDSSIKQQQQHHQEHQQYHQQSSSEDTLNTNSPKHPRFHLFHNNQNPPSSFNSISSKIPNSDATLCNKQATDITDSERCAELVPKVEQHGPNLKQLSNGVSKFTNELSKNHKNNTQSLRNHVTNDSKNENKNHNVQPHPSNLLSALLPKEKHHVEEIRRGGEPPLASPKNISYPADITNVKQHLRYQSPKSFSLDKLISASKEVEINVRPTVISIPSERTATENVRSSIDMAEKHLKESRFRHSPPILPRDIRSSAFVPTRDSLHLRTSYKAGFPGLPPSASDNPLYLSRLHQLHNLHPSSFSPVTSHHYQHSREAIENIIEFSRNPTLPSTPVRPVVSRTNGYSDSKAFNENYKPLISSFPTAHQKDRPSSLPVPDMYTRSEKKIPKHPNPFSVETLTQSHTGNNRNERLPDENPHHIERRFTQPPPGSHPHHPRVFHDRGIPPSHDLHAAAVAHERLHIPNGINIHNGLKRTLDEQLKNNISRVENERKYLDKLHGDWRRQEKERIITSPDERLIEKDRIILEKERLLHGGQARPPFRPDPRSPLHIPAYLARSTLPNGNISHHSNEALSPHVLYSHIRRMTPYPTPNKFSHS